MLDILIGLMGLSNLICKLNLIGLSNLLFDFVGLSALALLLTLIGESRPVNVLGLIRLSNPVKLLFDLVGLSSPFRVLGFVGLSNLLWLPNLTGLPIRNELLFFNGLLLSFRELKTIKVSSIRKGSLKEDLNNRKNPFQK